MTVDKDEPQAPNTARVAWEGQMSRTTTKTKKKAGRPSLYTKALAVKICRRLAEGESLRAVCLDRAMPDKTTILRWLADETKAEFRTQYAHARDMRVLQSFSDLQETDTTLSFLTEAIALKLSIRNSALRFGC